MLNFITPLHLIFYAFAFIAVCAALAVITARNPVHSVLSLVVTFFAMAGIWMLLHAEFLSLILVLVYVGAVMTLFLFVVMMLNIDRENKFSAFVNYWPFGVLIILLIISLLFIAIGPKTIGDLQVSLVEPAAATSNIEQLGSVLYTQYFYPFQIAGVLLLTAIIAAIILAHRPPTRRKIQNPSEQIAVNPNDRVVLVKMSAEKKANIPQIPGDSV